MNGDAGAGFGVGEGVVVVGEVVAAGGGDGLELVVGKAAAEVAAGGGQGGEELIVRAVHPAHAMDGLQAAFIETRVVRHEGQAFDHLHNLLPHLREYRRVLGVIGTKPVHPHTEPLVILRLGVNQRVERIHDLPSPHDYHTHAAHAAGLLVRRLEIYCCEISHICKDS